MAGIKVEEIKTTKFYTHEGIPFVQGDMILVEADGREVLGFFDGTDNGYFKMRTMDGSGEFKYRMATITTARVVTKIEFKENNKQEDEQ